MQLHNLKPQHKNKRKQRRGRGGKRGTYCGRGIKGQKARAGSHKEPIIRGLIKRYHKLKGYKQKQPQSFKAQVDVCDLDKHFKKGEVVSPKSLIARKIIAKIKGRIPSVKILGKGNISKALIVQDCELSKTAKERIEKAGGQVITNSHQSETNQHESRIFVIRGNSL